MWILNLACLCGVYFLLNNISKLHYSFHLWTHKIIHERLHNYCALKILSLWFSMIFTTDLIYNYIVAWKSLIAPWQTTKQSSSRSNNSYKVINEHVIMSYYELHNTVRLFHHLAITYMETTHIINYTFM